MIYKFTADDVIVVHDTIVSAPVMNRGALESAVAHPYAGMSDTEFFPTILEKGAVLLRGIADAHAFADGNKRTAWTITAMHLDLHGVGLVDIEDETAADFVERWVVREKASITDIASWLNMYQR